MMRPLAALALAAWATAAGNHAPQDVEVFLHGQSGYPCIRTPSVITLGSGALLAFAGTRAGPGDGCVPTVPYNKSCDHDDTVVRKSTDAGASWGPLRAISTANSTVRNHGASLWDAVHRQVVVVLSVDGKHQQSRGDNTLAVIRSSDEGESWSQPRLIAALGADSHSFVSPGRGLQLSSRHNHAGRIVFVAQLGGGSPGNVVFYTDDGGQTWVKSPTIVEKCNEAQIVELKDGDLLMVRSVFHHKLASPH